MAISKGKVMISSEDAATIASMYASDPDAIIDIFQKLAENNDLKLAEGVDSRALSELTVFEDHSEFIEWVNGKSSDPLFSDNYNTEFNTENIPVLTAYGNYTGKDDTLVYSCTDDVSSLSYIIYLLKIMAHDINMYANLCGQLISFINTKTRVASFKTLPGEYLPRTITKIDINKVLRKIFGYNYKYSHIMTVLLFGPFYDMSGFMNGQRVPEKKPIHLVVDPSALKDLLSKKSPCHGLIMAGLSVQEATFEEEVLEHFESPDLLIMSSDKWPSHQREVTDFVETARSFTISHKESNDLDKVIIVMRILMVNSGHPIKRTVFRSGNRSTSIGASLLSKARMQSRLLKVPNTKRTCKPASVNRSDPEEEEEEEPMEVSVEEEPDTEYTVESQSESTDNNCSEDSGDDDNDDDDVDTSRKRKRRGPSPKVVTKKMKRSRLAKRSKVSD